MGGKDICGLRVPAAWVTKLEPWDQNWLVVWNIVYDFPYIGNFIIPTDELHHFSEGLGSTTNQV